MSNPVYIDQESVKKAKKKDWLAVVEMLHARLDAANIPRGDEKGAYTLYFRICGLIAERDNRVDERLREHAKAIVELYRKHDNAADFANAVWELPIVQREVEIQNLLAEMEDE